MEGGVAKYSRVAFFEKNPAEHKRYHSAAPRWPIEFGTDLQRAKREGSRVTWIGETFAQYFSNGVYTDAKTM